MDCRFAHGAPEGARTHTLKAREPKSRMSTNSITGAYPTVAVILASDGIFVNTPRDFCHKRKGCRKKFKKDCIGSKGDV